MKDFSIVICGAAGQGIQTVEEFLVTNLKMTGYNVFATKEYMSRVRGGMNSTELRIGSDRVAAFVSRIDLLIPMHKDAPDHLKHRISNNTLMLADPKIMEENNVIGKKKQLNVNFLEIAEEIGGKIYANVVVVGVVSGLFNADRNQAIEYISKRFGKKGNKIVDNNKIAYEKGYAIGLDLVDEIELKIDIKTKPEVKEEILFNGNQSVGLGAIAGGCNFISAYPMSPSTGVLLFLAKHSDKFEIAIDQAEDEIAAVNKAIGAWYTGARAIASTSGGGFALMEEGISLAGIIESPLVIHIAQRPGPATGLPTRTGQEDLNLALYSGHGEFPRIIYAPGNILQAFNLTQQAFTLADELQIPIFLLTDQYFVDSYYNIPNIDVSGLKIDHKFVKTDEEYKRYKLTSNGISPRGIPGNGKGLIRVDSDEHDEDGQITEDMRYMRIQMVEKRFNKKGAQLLKHCVEPELFGPNKYEHLVICWGSNYHVVKEAITNINAVKANASKKLAMLHFGQVYPLHPNTEKMLKKAKKVFCLENNASGQFADVLKLHANYEIASRNKILKFSGEPFSVEEVEKILLKKMEAPKEY